MYTLLLFVSMGNEIVSVQSDYPSLDKCNDAVTSMQVNYGKKTQASVEMKCVKASK